MLTTAGPGARDVMLDGVRYVPIGWGAGRNRGIRLAGYLARLPGAVRRHRGDADPVVEDFFAPFSSMVAPAWSGRSTAGVVPWLHARDEARQYTVPVHRLERIGTRRHRQLIAISEGTAEKLRSLNPTARST